MNTREELINGLSYVKNQIQKILFVTNKQVEIVANFRQKQNTISTDGSKNQLKIAVIVLYIVYLFLNLILCFLDPSNVINLVITLACGVYIYFQNKKEKQNKLYKFVKIIFYIDMIWYFFVVLSSGSAFLIILTILFTVVSAFIVLKTIKKKNQKIEQENIETEQYNAEVQRQYDETVQELTKLKNDLYSQSGSWYPKDYYSLEAASFFLSAIENYKADNMKELVLLFDDTQYKSQMLASQHAIQAMSAQQLINQQEMIKQLKFANVLNIANIALQATTIGAVKANTAAVNSNTAATYSAANQTTTAIGNATNSLNNSMDKLRNSINHLRR